MNFKDFINLIKSEEDITKLAHKLNVSKPVIRNWVNEISEPCPMMQAHIIEAIKSLGFSN